MGNFITIDEKNGVATAPRRTSTQKALEIQARINRVQMSLTMAQMNLASLAAVPKYAGIIARETAAADRIRDHLAGLLAEYEREVAGGIPLAAGAGLRQFAKGRDFRPITKRNETC